jgi:hypothetical protein
MTDHLTPDQTEQPRCARCHGRDSDILHTAHLYTTADGPTRHAVLCDMCIGWFTMMSPWGNFIIAADYDREIAKPVKRGRKRRRENATAVRFDELYATVRRAYSHMHGRVPDDDEMGALLAPIMGWAEGDRRTVQRWLDDGS